MRIFRTFIVFILLFGGCITDDREPKQEQQGALISLNNFSLGQWQKLMADNINEQLNSEVDSIKHVFYINALISVRSFEGYPFLNKLKNIVQHGDPSEVYLIDFSSGGEIYTNVIKLLVHYGDGCQCTAFDAYAPVPKFGFHSCDEEIHQYANTIETMMKQKGYYGLDDLVLITRFDEVGFTCKAVIRPSQDQLIKLRLIGKRK